MYAQIKTLRYWKTEHNDLNGCQDAFALDAARGIFVVTDGAGTTLFPGIWADILANHFVEIPLMSNDRFEVEWWVRLAQEKYKVKAPTMAQLGDWSIRQKAQNQSSDSTLATLRFSKLDASSAQAELLVFGDSCIIIGNTHTKEIDSFVLQHAADFAQPPICIPSALKFFNRDFHICSLKTKTLGPEHVVILASDAVSKWIISGGGGRFTGEHAPWEAFQTIRELTEETWPEFIDKCREDKQMVNDDSTALILELKPDNVTVTPGDVKLGSTTAHDEAVIQERKKAFETAREEKNNELVAIYYGDGEDLKDRVRDVTTKEIEHAQKVANALKEVLRAFRQAQNVPGLAEKMRPVWRQYGPTLQDEKCAENIRETLQRNGVILSLSEPQPQPSPPIPIGTGSVSGAGQHMIQPLSGQSVPASGRQGLKLRFYEAYSNYHGLESEDKKENYQQFLQAVDELEAARTRYPDILRFNRREEEEIVQARKYEQAMQNLQQALNEGAIAKINTAYDLSLISERRVNAKDMERIMAARLWITACERDNDKWFLDNIHDLRKFFNLTQQDQDRIDLAQRRNTALKKFQDALRSRRLPDIASDYDPVLDTSKELTDKDRELLSLAQGLATAIAENDDTAIVTAYDRIKESPFYKQIAFTGEERERIQQAELAVKKMLFSIQQAVAKIKGREITLEQVRKMYVISKSIERYWVEEYKRKARGATDVDARRENNQQAASREARIASQQLPNDLLELLIRNHLFQIKMAEDKVEQAFQNDIDTKGALPLQLKSFETMVVADYPTYLKQNRLSEKDIEEYLLIKLRSDFFRTHFEGIQQRSFLMKKTMEEWLEKQKKDVVYLPSDLSAEKRAAWLADQVGWKE